MSLTDEKCVPCREGSPRLQGAELDKLLQELPAWKVVERSGIPRLERAFEFEEFSDALAFAVRVGMLAEREDHHPSILVEWGRATVQFWTHKVKGLHRNDAVSAAKTDALYRAPSAAR
jgi:4a-hydroxytetrahydrobiopterin dehydratase